jgi:3D (Asp-Asp-Asp) domain-containing protein
MWYTADKYFLCRGLAVLAAVLFLGGCVSTSSFERKAMNKKTRNVVPMKVTAYCKCETCCNWKRSFLFFPVVASGPNEGNYKKVGYCADGTKAKRSTIAADPALYPFGTVMYVPGYGWGEVHDTGTDIKGKHIDVYFHTHREAAGWGVKKLNVEVYK